MYIPYLSYITELTVQDINLSADGTTRSLLCTRGQLCCNAGILGGVCAPNGPLRIYDT